MKDINAFWQEFFEILRGYTRTPGKFVTIKKFQMPNSSPIGDMRAYVDSSVKSALRQRGFQYVQNHSDANKICLLDMTHKTKDYSNCIDEIEFVYDSELDKVEERVVKSTPKTEK